MNELRSSLRSRPEGTVLVSNKLSVNIFESLSRQTHIHLTLEFKNNSQWSFFLHSKLLGKQQSPIIAYSLVAAHPVNYRTYFFYTSLEKSYSFIVQKINPCLLILCFIFVFTMLLETQYIVVNVIFGINMLCFVAS